jgi:hypothetical protein
LRRERGRRRRRSRRRRRRRRKRRRSRETDERGSKRMKRKESKPKRMQNEYTKHKELLVKTCTLATVGSPCHHISGETPGPSQVKYEGSSFPAPAALLIRKRA